MFLISVNIVWSLTFFFQILYLISVISLILYLLPISCDILSFFKHKTLKNFEYLTGSDLLLLMITPLYLITAVLFSWQIAPISAWFGHIFCAAFQLKISYLILISFYILLVVYCSITYFSNKETYDYFIVCFNFFLWILFLFYSNTLLTVIFFIELLSTLIFLFLITSTFSTTYFYKSLNLNLHNYFFKSTPFFFLQSLMYFFWISLISSLNLFLFVFLFYLKFVTLEWNLFEFLFLYINSFDSFRDTLTSALLWYNLLFCLFLKCGLVPFYFWKPIFFKGLPIHALMFYILFFYFFIFLFFLLFLIDYFNEIFYSYLQLNIFLLLIGFVFIFFILCESFYIKTFLALSSILNSLFIFLSINGLNSHYFFF